MEFYAITVYVISSEILKMLKIDDEVQAHMSTAAELATEVSIIASTGNPSSSYCHIQ